MNDYIELRKYNNFELWINRIDEEYTMLHASSLIKNFAL